MHTDSGAGPRKHNVVIHLELFLSGTIHSNLLTWSPQTHPDFPKIREQFTNIKSTLHDNEFWQAILKGNSTYGHWSQVIAKSS